MENKDMTAKEFFDAPGGGITLDAICNPEEKEFLLDMIELYAAGKVRQATKPSADVEAMAEAKISTMNFGGSWDSSQMIEMFTAGYTAALSTTPAIECYVPVDVKEICKKGREIGYDNTSYDKEEECLEMDWSCSDKEIDAYIATLPLPIPVQQGKEIAEKIAQWVIDNRYPKSENNKMSDFEMYHELVDKIQQAK
jgi:hypothetical protein